MSLLYHLFAYGLVAVSAGLVGWSLYVAWSSPDRDTSATRCLVSSEKDA